MTIVQAEQEVRACADGMRARYGDRVVFDEWAIISLANNKGRILGYIGPRKEGFRKNFASDITGLLGGLHSQKHQVGDFEFSRHGVGTGFEAFMVIGEHLYLICNNTTKSMDAIAKDPLWLSAQVPFVELSEKFRVDALVD